MIFWYSTMGLQIFAMTNPPILSDAFVLSQQQYPAAFQGRNVGLPWLYGWMGMSAW